MNVIEKAQAAIAKYVNGIDYPAPDFNERDLGRGLMYALEALIIEHKRLVAEREADEDHRETFGTTPARWREPLGALRLTLAGDTWTCAEKDRALERARSECEELTRVLNEAVQGSAKLPQNSVDEKTLAEFIDCRYDDYEPKFNREGECYTSSLVRDLLSRFTITEKEQS